MKKIIIISLLAISVIFLFSGCDAILEAMFPDATGHGDKSGKNFVTIKIDIDKGIAGWENSEVWVELQGVNGTDFYDTRNDYAWDDGNPNNPAHIDLNFEFLPKGEYMANVWLDENGNGKADKDEPFASVNTPWGNTFPMPYPNPDDPTEMLSNMDFNVQLGTINIGDEPWLLRGDKVINIDDRIYSHDFYVQPVIKDHYTKNFKWYIWDGVKDQQGDVSNADYFSFNFDSGTLEGEYWIDISDLNINFPDGTTVIGPLNDSFMVKVVDDANINGEQYKLNVSSWGFDGPPFFLDYNTSYAVKVEVYDGVGTLLGSHTWDNALLNGGFDLTSDGTTDIGTNGALTYHAASSGPVDYVRVFVDVKDVDENISFTDDNDLATQFEVGIMSTDYDDGTYRWSDNYPDPRRYILYSDFSRLF